MRFFLAVTPLLAPKIGNRDSCATFQWGGDVNAMSAALAADAALAKLTDGIYYFPDDDAIYEADPIPGNC